jgi:hypothetical protein
MTAWQSRVADDERTLRNEVKLQVTRETFVGRQKRLVLVAIGEQAKRLNRMPFGKRGPIMLRIARRELVTSAFL